MVVINDLVIGLTQQLRARLSREIFILGWKSGVIFSVSEINLTRSEKKHALGNIK